MQRFNFVRCVFKFIDCDNLIMYGHMKEKVDVAGDDPGHYSPNNLY
jgi:hypothetical protein